MKLMNIFYRGGSKQSFQYSASKTKLRRLSNLGKMSKIINFIFQNVQQSLNFP
jgi:hypothetical protein